LSHHKSFSEQGGYFGGLDIDGIYDCGKYFLHDGIKAVK